MSIDKTERDVRVVKLMIGIYCKHHHNTKHKELCPECSQLLEYVRARRIHCPQGDNKPFCSNCKIHCYKPDMRAKIKAVMRYSGPRIVFSHPILATKHLIQTKREKHRLNKEAKQ